MLKSELSEEAKKFIFEHIDSIELLEVLFYLRGREQNWISAETISKDLRSSINSVAGRIRRLLIIGLVDKQKEDENLFKYTRVNVTLDDTIESLHNEYRVRPHQVYKAIFASSRQAIHFADAFLFTNPEKKKGDSNG